MHLSVLANEAIGLLDVRPGGRYIDGTGGAGGHAQAILDGLGGDGALLIVDRDVEAVERLRQRFASYGESCSVAHGNFADMTTIAADHGFTAVQGILMDLGMSSDQLDDSARGFSFAKDGPLDMRMTRTEGRTAAELVAERSEAELVDLFRRYGEEPGARRIAREIVRERDVRPFETTAHLAETVSRAVGGRRGRRHPATRVFQALRIAVNDELGSLERALAAAPALLAEEGRLAVISFHSLEDRMVKQFMRRHVGRWESLQQGGQEWIGEPPAFEWVVRKAVVPADAEIAANPRARSARLRVVRKREGAAGQGVPSNARRKHRIREMNRGETK